MTRNVVVALTLLLSASLAFGQESRLQPTQNPDVPYRLFNTLNIYTLLKLDTRDGRIWQVQWGADDDYRFSEPINEKTLASGGRAGRFTLYPTTNIYTFVLLDQDTGDAWHVQWGKPAERFLVHINQTD
jgi:WD40 repeat protein